MCNLFIVMSLVLAAGSSLSLGGCPDPLYDRLMSTPILQMTDGEYRYFRKHQGDCDDYDPCNDVHLDWIRDKRISNMTDNEGDYFVDRILDCGAANPCSLAQYIAIRDKDPFEMTHHEYSFYFNCRDECADYPFRRQKKLKVMLIIIGIAVGVSAAALLAMGTYYQ